MNLYPQKRLGEIDFSLFDPGVDDFFDYAQDFSPWGGLDFSWDIDFSQFDVSADDFFDYDMDFSQWGGFDLTFDFDSLNVAADDFFDYAQDFSAWGGLDLSPTWWDTFTDTAGKLVPQLAPIAFKFYQQDQQKKQIEAAEKKKKEQQAAQAKAYQEYLARGGNAPINPLTGQPYPIDPHTGLPYDPATGRVMWSSNNWIIPVAIGGVSLIAVALIATRK